jgi:hypothetical protein
MARPPGTIGRATEVQPSMTDRQWQKSSSLWAMLEAIRHVVPCRKVHLFAAAAIRAVRPGGRSRTAAERVTQLADALERYAQGQGPYADFSKAETALGRLRADTEALGRCRSFAQGAQAFPMYESPEYTIWPESTPALCDLLREVVGNPFRPSRIDPQWLRWNNGTVATLARSVRAEGDFALMPVLADALEDAGCDDTALLAHCRESREHVADCWVLGLLTEEPAQPRRSLEESWKHLKEQGYKMPLTADQKPLVPSRMPRYDDEAPLGFSFFRTGLEDEDVSNVTIPRVFFGRSSLERVAFRNTDLSESCMCWNDFIDCDFSRADLSRCDMRSSIFRRCRFVGAVLSKADLRRSTFEGCDFTGATLKGAKADEVYGEEYELEDRLSEKQRKSMKWAEDPGPEPDGG